jgi:chromosome segregation ATPase
MNSAQRTTLWDSLDEYKRRNPESVNPPSERIDPDIPGSYFWVIVVTNWQNLHPLVQDVLFIWYKALTRFHQGNHEEELDPKSTEALVYRLNELDSKLRAFDLERGNLEQELSIRDRDFQQLRKMTGKREKENIEVQQMLGKSFQEKIMDKQNELDDKNDLIKELENQILVLKDKLSAGGSFTTTPIAETQDDSAELADLSQHIEKLKFEVDERTRLLKEVSEKLRLQNDKLKEQSDYIVHLKNELEKKDQKIKEIKGLLQG